MQPFAGKTTITSLLFRLVEPTEGEIRIGETPIRELGRSLRSRLTIIPQEPMLFCGRLRVNLDPFEEFSDAQIWSALEKAHLAEFVRTLADGLGHEIADGGSNLRCAATIFAYSKRLFLASASVSSFALRAPFFERQMCSFSTRRPPRSTTKRTRSFS